MPGNAALTPAQMWTVSQAAAYLGFSEGGVRKLITQRKLAALRVGTIYRIDPADVAAFVERVGPADDANGSAAL